MPKISRRTALTRDEEATVRNRERVIANVVQFMAFNKGGTRPMNPLPAEADPLFPLFKAWQKAKWAEHALEARWHRAIICLIPPEYRAKPAEDPERTVCQAFKAPKVERLRRFADAAKEQEKTIRQQIVDT